MLHKIVTQAKDIAYGNVSDWHFTPQGEATKVSSLMFHLYVEEDQASESLVDPQWRSENLHTFLNIVRQLSDEEAGLPKQVREDMSISILSRYERNCNEGADQEAMACAQRTFREFTAQRAQATRPDSPFDPLRAIEEFLEQLSSLTDDLTRQLEEGFKEEEPPPNRCHDRFDKL